MKRRRFIALKRTRRLILAFACVGTLSFVEHATAQTYPSRPITMIVPFPPGVGTDSLARVLAEHMRGTLGQPVIVENTTGAGGTIGTARVARAAPDGYTLSVGNVGTHVVSPATYSNIQYHPLNDFEPVALIATTAYWIIGKNALPPKDMRELITWLKAHPDKASVAMVGTGGLDQIAGTYFQQKTGARFQFVPYRGGAPAIQDLVAGHVDLKFDPAAVSLPQVRSGQRSRYSAAPQGVPCGCADDLASCKARSSPSAARS